MKKITTLLASIFALGTVAFGQTQRIVLEEEFTQASCGPCAAENPTFNTLLSNNTTKAISLKYQTDWPGVDPMNAQNPSEVSSRVNYYSVSGVPDARQDGVSVGAGDPASITQTIINNEYAVPAPFTLSISHTFSSDYDSIFITCVITAAQDFTSVGTLKAHVALTEKTISFTSAPGTNGETQFYNVMRKMYPSAAGTTLTSTWTSGQTQTITFAKPVPSYIYSKAQLRMVAFIQDDGNKSVKQAAFSLPQSIPVDIGTTSLTGLPLYQCATSFTPTVTIKNFGTTTLTSCDINYKIDAAGTVTTVPWTGSLATGASTTVNLSSVTAAIGSHTFYSYTSNPNGGADFDGANNQTTKLFTIIGTSAAAPLNEGFIGSAFPPAGWFRDNPDNGATWARKSGVGGFGTSTSCAKMDFFNSPSGKVDVLYAKNIDFTGIANITLKFQVAYARYSSSTNDALGVSVSSDCGATWTSVYSKSGSSLSTNGGASVTTAFTPTASQWRAETVDLSAFAGQSNVMIKFVATSAYGNNLYLDNINLFDATTTGIITETATENSMNVYPNPATDNATVNFTLGESAKVQVSVVDALGRVIISADLGNMSAGEQNYQLNTESLNNGLYFVNVQIDGNKITKRIAISK